MIKKMLVGGRAVVFFGVLSAACTTTSKASAQSHDDRKLCQRAIMAAETRSGAPDGVLRAIGWVESGRFNGGSGQVQSWPWTINAGGRGRYYATKAEAVAAAEALLKAGQDLVDVGCMQVNLHYHPAAFASLAEAFDPDLNAAYASRFLLDLFRRTGDWAKAIAAYHSQTPELGAGYLAKVSLLRTASVRPAPLRKPVEQAADDVYTPEFSEARAEDALIRADRIEKMHFPQTTNGGT